MLIFTLIVALLVSFAAVAYVAWPLMEPGLPPVVPEDSRVAELIARKDATLAAIKELEFDYGTGKLSEEDYQQIDQRLRQQAIGYMKTIERLSPDGPQLEHDIESDVASMRQTEPSLVEHAANAAPTVSASSVSAPAARQRPPSGRSAPEPELAATTNGANVELGEARFCTNCGNALQPEHKFCGKCGTPNPTYEGVTTA